MVLCYLCRWNRDHKPKRTFHRFPLDYTLRQKWLDIIGRSNRSISNSTALCNLHFSEDCYKLVDGIVMTRKVLKEGSLPSLYLTEGVSAMQNKMLIESTSQVNGSVTDSSKVLIEDETRDPNLEILYNKLKLVKEQYMAARNNPTGPPDVEAVKENKLRRLKLDHDRLKYQIRVIKENKEERQQRKERNSQMRSKSRARSVRPIQAKQSNLQDPSEVESESLNDVIEISDEDGDIKTEKIEIEENHLTDNNVNWSINIDDSSGAEFNSDSSNTSTSVSSKRTSHTNVGRQSISLSDIFIKYGEYVTSELQQFDQASALAAEAKIREVLLEFTAKQPILIE